MGKAWIDARVQGVETLIDDHSKAQRPRLAEGGCNLSNKACTATVSNCIKHLAQDFQKYMHLSAGYSLLSNPQP